MTTFKKLPITDPITKHQTAVNTSRTHKFRPEASAKIGCMVDRLSIVSSDSRYWFLVTWTDQRFFPAGEKIRCCQILKFLSYRLYGNKKEIDIFHNSPSSWDPKKQVQNNGYTDSTHHNYFPSKNTYTILLNWYLLIPKLDRDGAFSETPVNRSNCFYR